MTAINVDDVYKKFKVYFDKGSNLRDRFLAPKQSHYEDRWVLKGISFQAEKGDVIGLIGENGSGKSTLLKMMTRIMYPDKGKITMNGRVSSLIELGAGFHAEMSGRANIYTNASIFGLTRKEIDKRIEDIIAFSELGESIDNPVRTYSSGMYMRLAFSVAINVDADILLIDEILAVGDANFQAKCYEKLTELKGAGVTIVLVTHSTGTVESFCTSALWLNNGQIASFGPAVKTVDDYLSFMNEKKYETAVAQEKQDTMANDKGQSEDRTADINKVENEQKPDTDSNHFGLRYVEITKAEILNKDNVETSVIRACEPVKVVIHYKVNKQIEGYVFGFSFYTIDGKIITGSNTRLDRLVIPNVKTEGRAVLSFDSLPFVTGKYILQVAIVDQNGVPMDFYRDYSHFEVVSEERDVGLVSIAHEWSIE